ncbi:thiol-disulfide isomerase/thioredoxin [Paraburkholderia eburnea]|uniref:Thiol-disulfide isomerase/thioredoxin n=1 Tax=Paraburkholderia eburnea TaxID=1189126 RepID=A0A2S4LW36_9BURK|nr:TlpA disulfide reductase family protein [Paraburkholderia eburnea]POR46595.1 thiol-disulfide isomerase/thioredoxin [Paraburkholderia eburnea]PRZ16906.1 thiol-disulfide isomerase/thioredoxin [Paraburkholderia eburnea]
MNTKRILAGVAVAAVAACGGILAGHLASGGHEGSATGITNADAATVAGKQSAVDQLWSAAVTNPDGKPQSLAIYKGHPIVVNFWASWCGPCVEEMPELSALHREYAKKGIQFVGLGVDSAANIKTFLGKVKVDYPIYIAGFGGADVARAFGNNAGGLPYTVVIDANGAVRATKLGQIKPDELRHTLDAL